MKKFITSGSILISILSIVLSVYFINKWHSSFKNAPVEHYISGDSLYSSFHSNAKTASQLYLNKKLHVDGIISEAYLKSNNDLSIYIWSEKYAGIKCYFNDKDKQFKKPIVLGKPIELQGICTRFDENVFLTSCKVINY